MAGGSREPAPEPALGHLAADGLLAIFFVAGLELQREFVAGDQRDPRRAALPVAAAVGVMAVPALLYLAQPVRAEAVGCAIPTATDIAFALAVLAVINTHLPAALRVFLLTLAVVDDLLAITTPCRCWAPCSPSGCSRCWCGGAYGRGGCCSPFAALT